MTLDISKILINTKAGSGGPKKNIASRIEPAVKEIKAINKNFPFHWAFLSSDSMDFLAKRIPVIIVVKIAKKLNINNTIENVSTVTVVPIKSGFTINNIINIVSYGMHINE